MIMEVNLQNQLVGNVLIVEDDETTGTWLFKRMEKAGIKPTWVTTKDEALSVFNERAFHAVVTDIFLDQDRTKRGGLEIVREIGRVGTPLVVMTSAADLEIAKESMNHGASFLLEKPFDSNELLQVLNHLWEEPKGLVALLERFMEVSSFTEKEREITRLLVKGLSNREVAEVTGNTEKTIKYHLTTIFEKSGVKSRTELFNAIFPT